MCTLLQQGADKPGKLQALPSLSERPEHVDAEKEQGEEVGLLQVSYMLCMHTEGRENLRVLQVLASICSSLKPVFAEAFGQLPNQLLQQEPMHTMMNYSTCCGTTPQPHRGVCFFPHQLPECPACMHAHAEPVVLTGALC